MKSTMLFLGLVFALNVQAEDVKQSSINQQQLAKRPYVQVVEPKKEVIEGKTITVDKAEQNYKTLNLHQLGKRPYAVKNTD
jgi:hypothetical protein